MTSKKVILIEASEIIRHGMQSMLRSFYEVTTVETLNLNWIRSRIQNDSPNVIILNPSSAENIKEGIKTLRQELINVDFKLVALVYAYFDEAVLSLFDEVIFINDSESKIAIKLKQLQDVSNEPVLLEENTSITQRELDVIRLIALGYSNREIADELFISTHTVISHRKNITSKLGIKSTSGITIYAVVNKLISSEDFKKTI